MNFAVRSDLFIVHQVRIKGNSLLANGEILEALEIPSRVQLWRVQPERLESRLVDLSLVRSAKIKRVLPQTLLIEVAERSPIVDWRDPRTSKTYALDEEGVVLGESAELAERMRRESEADPVGVERPLLVGLDVWGRLPGDRLEVEGLSEVLTALGLAVSREDDWTKEVLSIESSRDGRGWVLHLTDRMGEIRLGNRRSIERVGTIQPVWRFLVRENLQVHYVDLRFEEQGILVRPRNCAPDAWMEIATRYPEPREEGVGTGSAFLVPKGTVRSG